MANNTIGSFLAALRKASGMTQRDLAERLNVSDKTVSRWERDEGAPDLSLIPVIAEIFGVTCDELLRGERKPANQRDELDGEPVVTVKGEKAVRRLLQVTRSQYGTRTMITLALAAAGVIAALVANSFHRAQLGFWLNCLFDVAAVLCQGVFLNRTLLAVSTDDLPEAEVQTARQRIIVTASRVFGVIAMLCAAMLPLLIVVPGAYYGLSGMEWCIVAVGFAAVAWVLWLFIHDAVMLALLKRGRIMMAADKEAVFRRNVRFKRKSVLLLAVLLTVTGTAHGLMSSILTAHRMAETIEFGDYESFAEFMAEDHGDQWGFGSADVQIAPIEVITSEDAYKRELTLSDGTVVLEYEDRNRDVVALHYAERDGTLLPIYVITEDALIAAGQRVARRNAIFCGLYAVEITAAFLLYWKRRAK